MYSEIEIGGKLPLDLLNEFERILWDLQACSRENEVPTVQTKQRPYTDYLLPNGRLWMYVYVYDPDMLTDFLSAKAKDVRFIVRATDDDGVHYLQARVGDPPEIVEEPTTASDERFISESAIETVRELLKNGDVKTALHFLDTMLPLLEVPPFFIGEGTAVPQS